MYQGATKSGKRELARAEVLKRNSAEGRGLSEPSSSAQSGRAKAHASVTFSWGSRKLRRFRRLPPAAGEEKVS